MSIRKITFALILLSVSAFALSPCPTGVPSGVTNCYYIAADGVDTNTGLGFTITNLDLTANVLTVTATNTLTVGQTVEFNQISNSNFSFIANKAAVAVATASGSQFTVAWVHANQASAASSGIAMSPWLFAPKMGNCASNCLNKNGALSGYPKVSPGDGFIIRGGDTWYFGPVDPSGGASTYMGSIAPGNGAGCDAGFACSWTMGNKNSLTWLGTTSSWIYFGNNSTINWFNPSAGSYARALFQGNNPHTTSLTGVASCTWDDTQFTVIKPWSNSTGIFFDDMEFDGFCSGGGGGGFYAYITTLGTVGTTTSNMHFRDLYMHGWSAVTYSCASGNIGNCVHNTGIAGTSNPALALGDEIERVVFDFSDSAPNAGTAMTFAGYNIHHSYFKSVVQGIMVDNNKVAHDNVFDSVYGHSDQQAHGNVLRQNLTTAAGDNAIYNNVIKDSYPDGAGCDNPIVYLTTNTGFTDYVFNNILYNTHCPGSQQFWDECVKGVNSACTKSTMTITEFNNTIVTPAPISSSFNANTPSTIVINRFNFHCIVGSLSSPGTITNCLQQTGGATVNTGTGNVVWDTATATGQGYTAVETYPYSPLTALKLTVGTGQDMSSTITTMLASADPYIHAAGEAAANSTGFGIIYDAANHRITASPATAITPVARGATFDTGAYEFSTATPPLTLTAACSGAGSGTCATTQGGHTLSATCTAGVASGTTTEAHGVGDNVALSCSPTSGALATLTGGGCAGSPCSINSMQGNITVTAQFALFPTTTLTCSTACNVQYGTTVTLASTIANLTGITTDTWTLYDPLLTPVVTCTGVSCNGTFNGGTTPSLTFTPLLSGPYTITAQSNSVSSNTSTVNINVGFSMGGKPAGAVGH